MVPVSITHKVIELSLGRMHGCFERALSWIRNRSRWKAGVFIRVVGGIEMHIVMMQSSAVSALH